MSTSSNLQELLKRSIMLAHILILVILFGLFPLYVYIVYYVPFKNTRDDDELSLFDWVP